jgi:DNA polymerase
MLGLKTHRLSGEWAMNAQNLNRDPTKSKLRTSVKAPHKFKLVAGDSMQIEARLVAQICGQTDLLDAFRRGVDVYAEFAGIVFGRPITKKDNPVERFIGKTGVLGLGYGCGWLRFYQMVTEQARAADIDLQGVFNEQVAKRTVEKYRALYSRIPAFWKELDRHKRFILLNDYTSQEVELGPVTVMSRRIRLPNGLFLRCYDDPPDKKLWGGKLLEHICQSLARVIVMQAALRIHRKGLRLVLQAHDELVYLVPDDRVEEAKGIINAEMIRSPKWLPELPLAAEIGSGDNYGNCR